VFYYGVPCIDVASFSSGTCTCTVFFIETHSALWFCAHAAKNCAALFRLDLHVVYAEAWDQRHVVCDTLSRHNAGRGGHSGTCRWYAINAYRNIAWHYVRTRYVLLLDVDFIVTPGLDDNFDSMV